MAQFKRALVREGGMVRESNVGDASSNNHNVANVTATATLTLDQLIGGLIIHTITLAADATYTLPTAAAIIAAFNGMDVGDSYTFNVTNSQAAAFDVVIAVGAGITAVGTNNSLSVAPQSTRLFTLVKDSDTAMSLY